MIKGPESLAKPIRRCSGDFGRSDAFSSTLEKMASCDIGERSLRSDCDTNKSSISSVDNKKTGYHSIQDEHEIDAGNESDATEVTTNASPQPVTPSHTRASRRSRRRSAKERRWSSGASVFASRSNATSRRSNDSSSSSECSSKKKKKDCHFSSPKKPTRYLPEIDLDADIDLKSKPGCIQFISQDGNEQGEAAFEHLQDEGPREHEDMTTASSSRDTSSSKSSTSSALVLTQERVRAHVRDYYEDFDSIFRLGKSSQTCWETFFSQYFTDEIQWVRSSSNSLTGKELAEHFANDIVGIRMKLVSINSIQILTQGLSAVVTFTADQKFIYRGTPNSDRAVITMVLNVVNGTEIRIAHEHRCTGMPIPQDTRWD